MTLTQRLRQAALARAHTAGATVDDYVLDEDGVLDLRDLDNERVVDGGAGTPASLGGLTGRFGDASDVEDLYVHDEQRRLFRRKGGDDATAPVADRAEPTDDGHEGHDDEDHHAHPAIDGNDDHAHPAIETDEIVGVDPHTGAHELSKLEVNLDGESVETGDCSQSGGRLLDMIDPKPWQDPEQTWIEPVEHQAPVPTSPKLHPRFETEEDNPATGPCPRCSTTGTRDLIDRLSGVDFWSCPHCHYMWQSAHTD